MSPLVQECQRTLIDISTRHSVGLFWVPELSRVRGSDIADELAREETVHQFVLPEPALGVSRQNIRKKGTRLVGQPAYGHVPGSYLYLETRLKIDFGP